MLDQMIIYVDRLRGGGKEVLKVQLPPDLFDFRDPEIALKEGVKVQGSAYLANGELVFSFSFHAALTMPCRVCNRKIDYIIELTDVYWMIDLSDVKGAKVDATEIIVEFLMAEIPPFVECGGGTCTHRQEQEPFLPQHQEFHPFRNL